MTGRGIMHLPWAWDSDIIMSCNKIMSSFNIIIMSLFQLLSSGGFTYLGASEPSLMLGGSMAQPSVSYPQVEHHNILPNGRAFLALEKASNKPEGGPAKPAAPHLQSS